MSKSRPVLCLAFAVGMACWTAVPLTSASRVGEQTAASEGQVANLKTQLEAGLKARLPSEFAFIARVIAMVEAKQLPFDLVQSTFMWARVKKPYPFPYFEHGLRTRAAKQGIEI